MDITQINRVLESLPRPKNEITSLASMPSSEESKPTPSSIEGMNSFDRKGWQDRWLKLNRHHPKMNELANEVQRWCGQCVRNHRNSPLLIVVGDNGSAKTHALKAAHAFIKSASMTGWEMRGWSKPIETMYFDWEHLAQTEDELILKSAAECNALFLDDIGAETDRFKSGLPTERLRHLLGERENKFTMITTNIWPKQWPSRWDARVNDRLLRKSRIVKLDGVPSFATL